MTENWKPIPGFEGQYEVSDRGQVASLPRSVVSRWGTTYTVPRRVLVGVPNRGGYLRLQLSQDAFATNHSVHVLVLLAFVGPRPEGMLGCHNDGNPANNHLSNLRWDTPSSNSRDTVKHGTNPQANKTHCKNGHEFTPENTRILRDGRGRRCRACHRESQRIRNAAARSAA